MQELRPAVQTHPLQVGVGLRQFKVSCVPLCFRFGIHYDLGVCNWVVRSGLQNGNMKHRIKSQGR